MKLLPKLIPVILVGWALAQTTTVINPPQSGSSTPTTRAPVAAITPVAPLPVATTATPVPISMPTTAPSTSTTATAPTSFVPLLTAPTSTPVPMTAPTTATTTTPVSITTSSPVTPVAVPFTGVASNPFPIPISTPTTTVANPISPVPITSTAPTEPIPIAVPTATTTTTTTAPGGARITFRRICLPPIALNSLECACPFAFFRNATSGLCEVNCSQILYGVSIPDSSSSCACQRGYFWNGTSNSCWRDCSNVKHSNGNIPGNPTVCNCVRPFLLDGNTCRLDCTRMSYSTGERVNDNECKCNSHYRWDSHLQVCISGTSNRRVRLGLGLGLGLGLPLLLAAIGTILWLVLCPPKCLYPGPAIPIPAVATPTPPTPIPPFPNPYLNQPPHYINQAHPGAPNPFPHPPNQITSTTYTHSQGALPLIGPPPLASSYMGPIRQPSPIIHGPSQVTRIGPIPGLSRSSTVLPPSGEVFSSKTIYEGVIPPSHTQTTIVDPFRMSFVPGPTLYQ